jgi:hypothetical protein
MPHSSLSEAAARRAPSLSQLTEDTIINGSNPAEETPGIAEPQGTVDDLDKLRKPQRIPLTPLHVNIPVTLDDALRACMKEKDLEKTAVVQEALKRVLADYL